MDEDEYPSRIDLWVALALAASVLLPAGFGLAAYAGDRTAAFGMFAVAAFDALLLAALVLPCRYTLARDHLRVRHGFVRRRIAYADITAAEPSRDPSSAPALSLRRLKVSSGASYLLISPREREAFLAELRRRVGRARAASAAADALRAPSRRLPAPSDP